MGFRINEPVDNNVIKIIAETVVNQGFWRASISSYIERELLSGRLLLLYLLLALIILIK